MKAKILDILHNPEEEIKSLQKRIEEYKKKKYSYDFLQNEIER